jgi:MYXO-CTERM domain-containing protein
MHVDRYSDRAGGLCSGCNDHFQATFTPSSEWKQYTFTWSELEQLGFGDTQPSVCAAGLFAIQFQWVAGAAFELCIDDVAFTTPEGTAGPAPTDPVTPGAPSYRAGGGGGCGCGLPGAGAPASSVTALLAALGALVIRRRRALG